MKIVTVKELSEAINVKVKTLYQWSELGIMPSLKINGSLRFDFEISGNGLTVVKKDPAQDIILLFKVEGPRKGGKQ